MKQFPENMIAKNAIKAWKLTAMIYVLVLWLLTIGVFILTYIFEWNFWYGGAAIMISLLCTYLFIFLFPNIRWRRWRYEVFEQEVYIQHGVLIVSQTLVPMVRVQHVDTKQGPILKRFNLASVTISTAATTHEIPALLEDDATDLRDQISWQDADVSLYTSLSSTLANVDIRSLRSVASSSSNAGISCVVAAVEIVTLAKLNFFKIGPCFVSTCWTRTIGTKVCETISTPC